MRSSRAQSRIAHRLETCFGSGGQSACLTRSWIAGSITPQNYRGTLSAGRQLGNSCRVCCTSPAGLPAITQFLAAATVWGAQMPSSIRRSPLSFFEKLPTTDGVSTGARGRLPGALGTSTDPVSEWSPLSRSGTARDEDAGERISFRFVVGPDTYRLRRPGPAWSGHFYEEPVRDEEIPAILEEAARQHGDDVALVHLLRSAVSLVTIERGDLFVLMRLRPRQTSGGSAESRATYFEPPKPQRVPSRPPPRKDEEPVISPDVAASRAAALQRASEFGAPFCEECARAAARPSAALA